MICARCCLASPTCAGQSGRVVDGRRGLHWDERDGDDRLLAQTSASSASAWETGTAEVGQLNDPPWRIRATPGSAWACCASKGFAVWVELCLVLIGLALAGVPLVAVAVAVLLSFGYLGWRGFSAHVSFDGDQLVRIRNGLRSYSVPVASIVGSAVVCRFQIPPRLALKVERDGRATRIVLDGTARITRKGRGQVVELLRHQSIIRPAVLLAFQTTQF